MDALAGFLAAAVALIGSPGPNTLSLAAVSAAFGRRRGLRYMAGLVLGMAIVIAITGTGMSGLVLAVPGVAPFVSVLAAMYFVFLAYRIATAPVLGETAGVGHEPGWIEGVTLSLVNPKAWAAIAALFSGFVLVEGNLRLDGMMKAVVLILTIIVANIGWLFAGAALTPLLRQRRSGRLINRIFAFLLILSVVFVVFL